MKYRLFGLLMLWSAAASAQEVELRAGMARVDVTPSTLGPMYGYANRKCGPANGVHDPLFAKAVVLATGDTRVAIVTLDLGSMVSAKLHKRAAEELGIPLVLLASSHTHSAPAFLAPYAESPFLGEVEEKIFQAVRKASSEMFAAKLGVAKSSLQLGYNRLLMRDDGRARALFDNLQRVPYGPVDPEFTLLEVAEVNGSRRALLVHYAAHAVVLGPTNCKISADYPGVLQAKVEEALPGTQCMFVQGGAGDINPLFMARSGKEEEDFAVVQKMGETLAGEVIRANGRLQPIGTLRHPMRFKTDIMRFSERFEKDKPMEVGVAAVLINRQIAIAAVPGEPLHRLQKRWKEDADVPHPLFYGYTDTSGKPWPGYIPDLRSAAYGGYGADVSTRIETGAGEAIIERLRNHLYDLLDMWRDKPGRP